MGFKFNPFLGNFDMVGSGSGGGTSPENFSYQTIAMGVTVTIPVYQQMNVVGGMIDIIGTLNIDGELALVD